MFRTTTMTTCILLALIVCAVVGFPQPNLKVDDSQSTEGPDEARFYNHPDITQVTYRQYQRTGHLLRQVPTISTHQIEDKLQDDTARKENSVSRTSRAVATVTSEEDKMEPEDSTEDDAEPDEPEEMMAHSEADKDLSEESQHFFPSFVPLFQTPPPLGHSRPQVLFHQEAQGYQRSALLRPQHSNYQPASGFGAAYRDPNYLQQAAAGAAGAAAGGNVETPAANGLLGSGNFGVIRGGTFYSDDDRGQASEYGSDESQHAYSPYYHSNNNGHGRPSSFYNPRPQQPRGPQDFFANFRDFADINTPTKSSFSEVYVVYANKNSTDENDVNQEVSTQPKNIIEQLKLLDQDDSHTTPSFSKVQSSTVYKKHKKYSKAPSAEKLKLENWEQDKHKKETNRDNKQALRELYEPLLALS